MQTSGRCPRSSHPASEGGWAGTVIRDGFLIDITEAARKVGFAVPVAITQDASNYYVALTRQTQDRKGFTPANEAGRHSARYGDLALLRRGQEPLPAPFAALGSTIDIGPEQVLLNDSENPSDVV